MFFFSSFLLGGVAPVVVLIERGGDPVLHWVQGDSFSNGFDGPFLGGFLVGERRRTRALRVFSLLLLLRRCPGSVVISTSPNRGS